MSGSPRLRVSSGCIVIGSVVASAVCVALAVVVAVASWPRLLVPLLGLESRGSLVGALQSEPASLTLEGPPLVKLDQIEFRGPAQSGDLVELAASELAGASFAGEQDSPGASNYLLVLDQVALNALVSGWLIDAEAETKSFRDVWVDLQPGGMILFADVNLGLRWQRAGLLFVQEGTNLRAERLVLGDESFALPESDLLVGRIGRAAAAPQRVIDTLVVTGPLEGEARIQELRFHPDCVEVHLRAVYPIRDSGDTGWILLERGVELREMDVPARFGTERATIVRLDPAAVRFRVGYDPGTPRRLSTWASDSYALVAINGGFFTPEYAAIGLVVSAGQRHGATLDPFAGMFAVTPDDGVSVRWLAAQPYSPDEPLREAVQSYPVLVKPGGEMGFPADADDGSPDRRTVIAQDRSGSIVVVVAPGGLLSLHELAVFLASPELDLNIALNLDGGTSTGIWLTAGGREIRVEPGSPLPTAILVEQR